MAHEVPAQDAKRVPAGPARTAALALIGAIAALAVPAAALAAPVLTPDKACYLTGQPMKLTGSGFAAGAAIDILRPNVPTLSGKAGATGGFVAKLFAPTAAALGLTGPGAATLPVTARDPATRAEATAEVRIAALSYKAAGGTVTANTARPWAFSGFIKRPGKPIYGHFLFGGKLRGNHRFGTPTGPCGELTIRARPVPIVGRPARGSWTVQVDQNAAYRPKEPFKVRGRIPVRPGSG